MISHSSIIGERNLPSYSFFMYELRPEITKEYILRHVSQEEIMERFLGTPVVSHHIRSPLRDDRIATCRFYRNNGRLYFKDFRGDFHGDCFDVVMHKYNIKFKEAMDMIANEFGLTKSEVKRTPRPIVLEEREYSKIEITSQPWTNIDKRYWLSYGINGSILQQYEVKSCQHLFLNDRVIYSYSDRDPAYAYKFFDGYKIYFPKRKETRFISNTHRIQGYKQLDKEGDLVIITKSLKDVMALRVLGHNAIAPQSESSKLEQKLVDHLRERFEHLFLLYDNDAPGELNAEKTSKEHNIPMRFLPKDKAKDVSDCIKKYGIEYTKTLINTIL
jgi:hypothetical protein